MGDTTRVAFCAVFVGAVSAIYHQLKASKTLKTRFPQISDNLEYVLFLVWASILGSFVLYAHIARLTIL